MTDAEWRACDDPTPMLDFVLKKRDRKLRLAAVGVCRLFLDFLDDERITAYVTSRHKEAALSALSFAERVADVSATEEEQEEARKAVQALAEALRDAAEPLILSGDADETGMQLDDAANVVSAIGDALSSSPEWAISSLATIPGTEFLIARTLREVFGPKGPVPFDHNWLTTTVTTLARQMYDSGDFTAMPILADALQDAGCDNDDILSHCRKQEGAEPAGGALAQPVPHVRGCWVLDLLLGKG